MSQNTLAVLFVCNLGGMILSGVLGALITKWQKFFLPLALLFFVAIVAETLYGV